MNAAAGAGAPGGPAAGAGAPGGPAAGAGAPARTGHRAGPRIAASLWSTPRHALPDEVRRLVAAGVRHLHWDRADGVFAPAGGFSPERAAELTELARSEAGVAVSAEAHLMVADPAREVDAWTEFCELVVVHAEAATWRTAVRRIADRGRRPGIALSPGTALPADVDELAAEPSAGTPAGGSGNLPVGLPVLIMSVLPGHAGSGFRPDALADVRAVARPGRLVGLDGSVTLGVIPAARAAGAGWLVSGSDLVGSADPAGWLRRASNA